MRAHVQFHAKKVCNAQNAIKCQDSVILSSAENKPRSSASILQQALSVSVLHKG